MATLAATAPPPPAATVDVDPEYADDAADSDSTRGSIDEQLSSFTSSLSSSVTAYPIQHGRRYHAYKDGAYILPNDEQEQDRLDVAHAMVTTLIGDRLFLAPLPEEGFAGRVLDAGCGTGIWAICMGDRYPDADVRGVDLSPIQPSWVPPNVHFEVDDIERPWAYGAARFDFVFTRYLMSSIRDWPALIASAFSSLKPGGWAEFQDYDAVVYSDDGSFRPEHAFHQWSTTFNDAAASWGRDPSPGPKLERWAKEAGFVNVRHEVFKLPIGGWPRDKRKKEAGMFNLIQVLDGLEGFTMRLFTGYLGWKEDEVKVFVAKARENLKDRSVHMLYDYHVVYGQKPDSASQEGSRT
ncbi:methyltransferase domain-containing protein [Diplodia corticola]|uniref:Methyltransferase domain-containing protein n=1 Tax=Diplodia corticola TaxID=236234 RepID=A0A1J9RW04_9PEZI|nr:methyltransferase domain-containing protein [Diplodia corticola]OJD32559.1 methyltransferase domain-containing protein [Diplodia corticola]